MKPILYLGDDDVDRAASYLVGIMAHYGLDYLHVPSNQSLPDDLFDQEWSVAVLSDFPSANMSPEQMTKLVERVDEGRGLLMFGGWGTYQGLDGGYSGTAVAEILPVYIGKDDDRVNWSGPCLVTRIDDHNLLGDLPFESDPPGVGGYNRVQAKQGSRVLLEARRYRAVNKSDGSEHRFVSVGETDPLLVIGKFGRGRIGCWTSDVAPHWVGGLVDWGPNRITAQGNPPAGEVEVGDLYAEFFHRLLIWAGGAM